METKTKILIMLLVVWNLWLTMALVRESDINMTKWKSQQELNNSTQVVFNSLNEYVLTNTENWNEQIKFNDGVFNYITKQS